MFLCVCDIRMHHLREESRMMTDSIKHNNRFRIFKGVKRSVTFNVGQNLPVMSPRRGENI